jgi:hypothetical protein
LPKADTLSFNDNNNVFGYEDQFQRDDGTADINNDDFSVSLKQQKQQKIIKIDFNNNNNLFFLSYWFGLITNNYIFFANSISFYYLLI